MKSALFAILIIPLIARAQYDSLPTLYLNNVTLQSFKTEGDTLQNFYRVNKASTTESILSRMNGISLIRRGAYGQEPMIHGMSSGQLNVTIDGMKMFGACTDKMDPVTIYVEPQNLRSINAAMGTNGSSLGTTVGGSIDMKLTSPNLATPGLTGKVGTGYQSVSSGLNVYAQTNYAWQKTGVQASLIYRHSNPYVDGHGEVVAHSQFEKMNFSAGLKQALARDTLRVDVLIDDGKNIGFPALPMDVGKAQAKLASVTLERPGVWGPVTHTLVKGYINHIYHSMDDSQRDDVVMHMDMPGWSTTWGAFVENDWKELGSHTLSTRVDFYLSSLLAEMTMYPSGESPMYMQTWPDSRRAVTGIYLSDALRIGSGLRLDLNGRIDYSATQLKDEIGLDQLRVFYPTIQPSQSAVTNSLNGTLQFRRKRTQTLIHVGYGERLPTTSELFGFYLFNRQDGYDYLGNPFLKTERSLAADITFSYFGNAWEVKGHGFYQHSPDYVTAYIDEAIDPMTPGAKGVKVYSNHPYATHSGFDLMLSVAPFNRLQILSTLKATYASANTGRPLPFIPPLRNVTSVRYNVGSVALQVEYEGGASQERVDPAFGESTTPAFHVFNARTEYQRRVGKKNLNVAAGVENMTNKYYREHLDWGGIPRPGRNFYLNLEISF